MSKSTRPNSKTILCVSALALMLGVTRAAFAETPPLAPQQSFVGLALAITPLRFELAGYPGEQLLGTVHVTNVSDALLPVTMEAEDFQPSNEDGQVRVAPDQEPGHSLKDWVRFDHPAFTLDPRQTMDVSFTIDLPANTEPGSRYGTIIAHPAPLTFLEGALVSVKAGALVIVDVYGDVREALTVADFQVPRLGNQLPLTFVARIANAGTIREKPSGVVRIRNMFGNVVAELPLPEHNVLPGHTRKLALRVSEGLWVGRYTAQLEAAYGLYNPITLGAARTFWFVDVRRVVIPSFILCGVAIFIIIKRKNFGAAFRSFRAGEE